MWWWREDGRCCSEYKYYLNQMAVLAHWCMIKNKIWARTALIIKHSCMHLLWWLTWVYFIHAETHYQPDSLCQSSWGEYAWCSIQPTWYHCKSNHCQLIILIYIYQLLSTSFIPTLFIMVVDSLYPPADVSAMLLACLPIPLFRLTCTKEILSLLDKDIYHCPCSRFRHGCYAET